MNAADHIDARVKACRDCMERMRGQLKKLEHVLPAASRWTGEIRHLMIDLNSQLQLLKVDMAVDVMTGQAEGRTPQAAENELELFAVVAAGGGQECPRSLRGAVVDPRILESLHRAGDHTLDDDPNVRVEASADGSGVARA